MDARIERRRFSKEAPLASVLAAAVLGAGVLGYAVRDLTDRTSPGLNGAPETVAAAQQGSGVGGDRWYLDTSATGSPAADPRGDRWYLDASATAAAASDPRGDRWYLELGASH